MSEVPKTDPNADVDPDRVVEHTPFDESEQPSAEREEVINTANKAASEVRGEPNPLLEGMSEAAVKQADQRRREAGLKE